MIRNDEGFTWKNSAWVEYRNIWVNSESERYLDKSDGKFYSQESQVIVEGEEGEEKCVKLNEIDLNEVAPGYFKIFYDVYIDDKCVFSGTEPFIWLHNNYSKSERANFKYVKVRKD